MKLHRCTHFMKIRFNEDYLQAILDYENNVIEKKDLCDKNINMKLIINKIFKLKLYYLYNHCYLLSYNVSNLLLFINFLKLK